MYFMGHSALALLLALPFLFSRRGRPGRDALGFTPGLVLLCILVGNAPDLLHVWNLRPLTHNLFAGVGIPIAFATLFRSRMALDRLEVAAVALAGLAHPLGDMAFGSYHPFFPFDLTEVFAPFPWNGPEDIAVEIPLAALVLLVLIHPRLAGRWLGRRWSGRDDILVRLALWVTIVLLSANLAVLVFLNLVVGSNRWPWALLLLAEGTLIWVSLVRVALSRRHGVLAEGRRAGTGPYR